MRRLAVFALFMATFAAGLALGAYFQAGATLIGMEASPDGRERVEFYHATRWQALFAPHADLLGVARLVLVEGDETLGTSEAFELSGEGTVIWAKDAVQVGASAVFDRSAGRWTVIK